MPSAAPTATTVSQIRVWVETNAASFNIDTNTFLIIYYPSTTTITNSSGNHTCLGGFALAYHDAIFVPSIGATIPFAVVPDCGLGIETLTKASSHELMEGATDPFDTDYHQVDNLVWSYAFSGSEIGDM